MRRILQSTFETKKLNFQVILNRLKTYLHFAAFMVQPEPEELDSPSVRALGVRSRKLSNALNGQSWDG
jgi:hypothetical protein